MKRWWMILIIFVLIAIGGTIAGAQPSQITPEAATIMVVFYNQNTKEVIGYAPYDENLEITESGVVSDTIVLSGVNWNIVTYGMYQYQDIPKRYVEIDGEEIELQWKLYELDLQPISSDDLPHSQHIAVLKEVNTTLARPATVVRRFMNVNYDVHCFVSQSAVSLWQEGKLVVGDYVIISFISEIPGSTEYMIPIVVDKVYYSW